MAAIHLKNHRAPGSPTAPKTPRILNQEIVLYDGTRMADLVIPYVLFQDRKNPYPLITCEHANPYMGKNSNQWLINMNHFTNGIKKALVNLQIYKFVALAYGATTSPAVARVIADYSAWNWIVDESLDNPKYFGNDPPKALGYYEYIKQYLTPFLKPVVPSGGGINSFNNFGPTGESFHEIMWRAKNAGFTDEQCIRFMRAQGEFLEHSHRMVKLRVGCSQDLSFMDYILNRRLTSGVETSFILGEWSVGVHLSNQIHNHEIIQQLLVAASDCLCFTNDVQSFPKDIMDGDLHNLVHVLWKKEGLCVKEAMLKATEMALIAANDIDLLEKCVESCDDFSETDKPLIVKYFYSSKVFCSGYMEWALNCKRYKLKGYYQIEFISPDTTAQDDYNLRPEIKKLVKRYGVDAIAGIEDTEYYISE